MYFNGNIFIMMFTCSCFWNIDCSFYDRSSPIYTQPRYLPPSKMLDADVTDSVIGEGCVIKVCFLELYQPTDLLYECEAHLHIS